MPEPQNNEAIPPLPPPGPRISEARLLELAVLETTLPPLRPPQAEASGGVPPERDPSAEPGAPKAAEKPTE